MDSTRISLLIEATAGSELAWTHLVDLYQPWVYGWLRRHYVAHHDAEELTQDVLAAVVRELPNFCHSGRTGAFRSWLRQITVNRTRGFWRAGKLRTPATGQSSLRNMIEQLSDERSDLSRIWDREHDHHVLRCLLDRIEKQFEPTTLKAFRKQVFDGLSAECTAAELGITLVAAYSAKSRVLRQLRSAASGLVCEDIFS